MHFKLLCILMLCFSIDLRAAEQPAKDFSLPDIQSKQQITLSNYFGKVIYLDFWASWCSSCAKALPLFNHWDHALGENFVVVSVNVDEDIADGLDMAAKLQLDFPIAYDKSLNVAKMYQASVLPSSFIIDKNGFIQYQHIGFQEKDAHKLKALIKHLLQN